MQKELNQDLFGESSRETTRSRYKESDTSSTHRAAQQTELKIAEARTQVQVVSEQMASLVSQVNDFIKMTQTRVDKLYQHAKKQDSNSEAFKNEVSQKLSMVHARLNERKAMDTKTQELIDRHNSVLKSHEVRMAQLQRLIAEKEAQILESQAALNDAKMEIARLKRI